MRAEWFIRRVFYVMAMAFFLTVGYFILGLAIPELLEVFIPGKITQTLSTSTATLCGLGGTMMILITVVAGGLGAFACKFSERIIVPEQVDALHAQGMVVFLIDQDIYTSELARYYNLKDLTKLRLIESVNFFGQHVEYTVTIAEDESKASDLQDVSITG